MGWSAYRKTGLTHYEPAEAVKGYTLVTPTGGNSSYLLDMNGRIVHRWRFPDIRPGYGRLLANGHLLTRGVDVKIELPPVGGGAQAVSLPIDQRVRRLGGNTTHLQEVDWDGNVVWEYRNDFIHHDFVRLPNGNTLIPLWVELPMELDRRVRGGVRRRGANPPMIGDDIIEIDPTGKEVWRARTWELLDPVKDPICPLEGRIEWTHINGLDVNQKGDLLFSCRNNSRVGIIEKASGNLTWKFGAPNVHHQHHATFLPNGNVQIFDNGMHRQGLPRSRIVEVNPKDNSIAWEYTADPDIQFFSAHISGAERLAEGNVLICEGAPGRIFEVTRRGDVVWEWINPFAIRDRGRRVTAIFRAHRYSPDHPGLADRNLDPARYAALNRLYGLEP